MAGGDKTYDIITSTIYMIEEYSVHQTESTVHGVPAPLMSFVEDEIARLEERKRKLSLSGMGNLDDNMKLAQYREYKQQLSQPQPRYDGIVAELQTQQANFEQQIRSLQEQIIPRSTDPRNE